MAGMFRVLRYFGKRMGPRVHTVRVPGMAVYLHR